MNHSTYGVLRTAIDPVLGQTSYITDAFGRANGIIDAKGQSTVSATKTHRR